MRKITRESDSLEKNLCNNENRNSPNASGGQTSLIYPSFKSVIVKIFFDVFPLTSLVIKASVFLTAVVSLKPKL